MRVRLQVFFAIFIFVIGVGSLLTYDLYLRPYVLSEGVVRVKSTIDYLPKNQVIHADDLEIVSMNSDQIPKGAVKSIDEVTGKLTSAELTGGTVLTDHLVIDDPTLPGPDEGIFTIPKESIYAINGSLRSLDKVDVYLIVDPKESRAQPSDEEILISSQEPFIQGAIVSYARSEENNDVLDAEEGNVNSRKTSTAKVTIPELKLKKDVGGALKAELEKGYKVWIVRVE